MSKSKSVRIREKLIKWRFYFIIAMVLAGCLLPLYLAAVQLSDELGNIKVTPPKLEEKQKVDKVSKTDSLTTILSRVCKGNSLCIKDLKAICTVETHCNPLAIGDGGFSYGAFQLYLKVHKTVSIQQAQDFEWSATWTYNHLLAYGYPTYRTQAIQCHNGCAKNNGYAQKVLSISNKL